MTGRGLGAGRIDSIESVGPGDDEGGWRKDESGRYRRVVTDECGSGCGGVMRAGVTMGADHGVGGLDRERVGKE